MARLPEMKNADFASRRLSGPEGGSPGEGPDPQDADEKSVQFINAEVLDPPAQGKISFVGPYIDQSLAMAVEDARSFLQGAEQILLIALAEAVKKYLVGPGTKVPPSSGLQGSDANPASEAPPVAAADMPANPPQVEAGMKMFEHALGSLATFHAAMAETAHKHRVDR